MQLTFLTHDGGPPPADKWAGCTAEQICSLIQVDQNSVSAEAISARKAKPRLELDLADVLERHHDGVQGYEEGRLKEHGIERLTHALHDDELETDVEQALDEVLLVADASPFGEHFRNDETKKVVAGILRSHFLTVRDIERSWHADRNSSHPVAKAYREARTAHGGGQAHAHVARYLNKAG